MEFAHNHANPNRSADRSVCRISQTPLGMRIKSFLTHPRLVLNSLMLFVFSALWIREFLYWIPQDAFRTSLNYWAYTDWLIDYSQGFIRRGLSGEILRLVPATIPPLEFVAVFSWILILVIAFGYVRLLARSWKTYHPLILFGLLFLPSLFLFYIHDHDTIARKEILGYVTLLLHLLIIEKSFPLGGGSAHPDGSLRMNARRNFPRAALWTGLLYLPAAIAFGAVYLAGTPGYDMLLGICNKWLSAGAIREGSCICLPNGSADRPCPAPSFPWSGHWRWQPTLRGILFPCTGQPSS